MRIEELRKALRSQPFRQFTIHLADGCQFPIERPEFMLISRSDRTIVVADLEGSIEIIDPMLVTSLTVENGSTGKGMGDGDS